MGHRGRSTPWGEGPASPWQSRGSGRHGHGFGGHGWGPGPGGPFERPGGGPPPWLAGLFGLGQPERGRGPRVRRGDVRTAILDVLATAARAEADGAGETLNGYQVIQQIAERSNEAWRPSPGSVYPTIQQLEDEGLVVVDEGTGRRSVRLTEAGQAYLDANPDEVAAVWAPFERLSEGATKDGDDDGGQHVDLKSEIGQVMPAVWQIVTTGSESQRRAAMEILADTRRRLYGVLADGPDAEG